MYTLVVRKGKNICGFYLKGIQMLDKTKNLWESNVNRTINKEVYFPYVVLFRIEE